MPRNLSQYFSNLKSRLKDKELSHLLKFQSATVFAVWYEQQMAAQENRCKYCKILETEVNEIVMKGKLTSKRFPLNGTITQGRGRGVHFEVDRKNPNGNYETENCVLICYFCNNDKSDIFSDEQYIQFMQNRNGFLKNLLQQ
jgi:hypothetical protein